MVNPPPDPALPPYAASADADSVIFRVPPDPALPPHAVATSSPSDNWWAPPPAPPQGGAAYPPPGSPPVGRRPPARSSGAAGRRGGAAAPSPRTKAKPKPSRGSKSARQKVQKAKATSRSKQTSRSAKAAKSTPRQPSPWARLAVVYDVDGPRIRLGVLWFALAFPAVVVGQIGAAAVYGATAGLAARQTAKAWRAASWQADFAAGLAVVPALLALRGPALALLALGGVGAVAVVAGMNDSAAGLRGVAGHMAAAGSLVVAIVPASLAALSMVLVRGVSVDAAVVLLVLASTYEIGDYLVGSGASNSVEGPLAGMAALIVVAFPMALLLVEPFDVMGMLLVGAAAACCPVGQWLASAVLPRPGAKAPALRRIDTLLLLAPLWAAAAGAF